MIKATVAVDPPIIENIPEQLTERPQWVCWRREMRGGKPTKVPHTPGTERRASSTDLLSWRTFEEARTAYERGEPPYDGIGFVFCSADPFVGILPLGGLAQASEAILARLETFWRALLEGAPAA